MGCGTGIIDVLLAKQGHSVLAADFSDGMLEKLSENARMHDV
ncbi:methyltransferase domain-containing protein, partial [Slackia piriformis]